MDVALCSVLLQRIHICESTGASNITSFNLSSREGVGGGFQRMLNADIATRKVFGFITNMMKITEI